MSLPLFLFFSLWLLFELKTFEEEVEPIDPACGSCGYSLRGLPGEGVCPECGRRYLPSRHVNVKQNERIVYRRGTIVYWLVCALLVGALEYWEVGVHLYAWGTIRGYLDDGYRIDVARNAAFKRELASGGVYLGWWLGSWWFGVTPIIGLMCRGWRRYVALAVGSVAMLAVIVVMGF